MDILEELKSEYNEKLLEIKKIMNDEKISYEDKRKILLNYVDENKKLFKEIRALSKEKEEKITDVIKLIRKKYNEKTGGDASATYTEGGCYYFPIMIKSIFPEENSQVYISSGGVETHALIKINDNYYDINGNIKNPIGDRLDEKPIDIKDYKEATGDDYDYFKDLCYVGRNKENMNELERISDEISYEICDEIMENNAENQKVA